jgi:pyridoxine 4-dehydrogenase
VPLADQLGALITAREQGKIRHIGLSKVTLTQLRQAETLIPIAAVQNYSDPDSPDAVVRDYCRQQDIAYVPFRPFAGGQALQSTRPVRPQVEHLFRAHLAKSPHTLLIPGTASATHLLENLEAFLAVMTERGLAHLA